MSDQEKSKEELVAELEALRQKLDQHESGGETGPPVFDKKITRRSTLKAWVGPVILSIPIVHQTTAAHGQIQGTTVAPTTMAPTTMEPTTMEPTTMEPTTMAPTTMEPTTMAPTTMAPTTMAPTTMAPTPLIPVELQSVTIEKK